VRQVVSYAVVVLAGGGSTRFGADKLALLLDGVVAGLPAEADAVVCVGAPRPTPSHAGVTWTVESPAGSGPLAAVAAGVTAAPPDVDVVVVVGGDMPAVGAAVPALVSALSAAAGATDAAVLVDGTGHRQPLASAWRRTSLVASLSRIGDPAGLAARRLLENAAVVEVPDTWGAAHDIDTPADL
jgi:molybdenum cofactor guanylyltransferase